MSGVPIAAVEDAYGFVIEGGQGLVEADEAALVIELGRSA